MRRGKQAAGILLCMMLAVAAVPEIPANAEETKTENVQKNDGKENPQSEAPGENTNAVFEQCERKINDSADPFVRRGWTVNSGIYCRTTGRTASKSNESRCGRCTECQDHSADR